MEPLNRPIADSRTGVRGIRKLAFILALVGAAQPLPAQEQTEDGRTIIRITIYGDDSCPTGTGDEVVVCARRPESERYREPRALRRDPPNPAQRSWADPARALDEATPGRLNHCSADGPACFTGCLQQQIEAAEAEKEAPQ